MNLTYVASTPTPCTTLILIVVLWKWRLMEDEKTVARVERRPLLRVYFPE